MSSTPTPAGTMAALLASVQQQVDLVRVFKNEQISLYVSTDPTTTVTDAEGNPVTVPTWQYAIAQVSQNALDLSGINTHLSTLDTSVTTINGQIGGLQTLTTQHTTDLGNLQTQIDGLGGGGSGGGLTEWDGKASEVSVGIVPQAYGFRSLMSEQLSSGLSDATIADKTVSAGSTVGGFRLKGGVPNLGTHWLVVDTTFNGSDSSFFELGFVLNGRTLVDHDTTLLSECADVAMRLRFSWGTLTADCNSPHWAASTTRTDSSGYPQAPGGYISGLVQLLIVTSVGFNLNGDGIRIPTATIDVYDAHDVAGASPLATFTYTGPNDGTLQDDYLAGMSLVGTLRSGGATAQLTFIDDAASYTGTVALPPTSALSMREATLPAGTNIDAFVMSTTATHYDNVPLKPVTVYAWTTSGMLEVPNATKVPSLTGANTWTGKNGFDADVRLGARVWFGAADASDPSMLDGTTNGNLMFLSGQVKADHTLYGYNNIIFGDGAMQNVDSSNDPEYNVILGLDIAPMLREGYSNTLIGYEAGYRLEQGSSVIAIGTYSMGSLRSCNLTRVTVIGSGAGNLNDATGTNPTSYIDYPWVQDVIAIGTNALDNAYLTNSLDYTIAIGNNVGAYMNSTDGACIAIGSLAMNNCHNVKENIAIGNGALRGSTVGSYNVALGTNTMQSYTGTVFDYSTALGYGATVTGSNQVQLGNGASTTYAYGAVQNRSDERDKAEIRPTVLGLDFINAVEAVDFKWDMREDYVDYASRPVEPTRPDQPPREPTPTQAKADPASYDAWKSAYGKWQEQMSAYEAAMVQYQSDLAVWKEANSFDKLVHDGTHTRKRFHSGVIAQQVKTVMDQMGVDFGGYQDHSLSGGADVRSVGYEEFIAPLIRSVQELTAMVKDLQSENADLKTRVSALESKPA